MAPPTVIDPDEVEIRLATLHASGMTVVPAREDLAVVAGLLQARHDDKKTCTLSQADRFAAATALHLRLSLATADPDLLGVVRAEHGAVHVLPGT